MALIERLAGINTDQDDGTHTKLSVGAFWAHLYELAAGARTQAQIISYFSLSADYQAELSWLIGRYIAQRNATAKAKFVELVNVIFYMAEARVPGYTTNAEIVARFNAI